MTAKKLLRGILILSMVLVMGAGIVGCTKAEDEKPPEEPIKIATLNGPTGIGMTYLMENPEKYQITIYQSPDEIVAKVITGEIDLAAVPSNMASVLNNKTKGQVLAIGTHTLGILNILENGQTISTVEDLKGKTLLASGQGGAPEYILKYILEKSGLNTETDVQIKWMGNHTEVMSALVLEENAIAMLPEPFATVAESKSETINRAIDLNEVWKTMTDTELPMGVLIAQKSFAEERGKALKDFIKVYKDSVNLVNENPESASKLIVKYGLISDEAIAEKAIPECNIVMITGKENKKLLSGFYDILYKINPKSIGGKSPDEDFYYKD